MAWQVVGARTLLVVNVAVIIVLCMAPIERWPTGVPIAGAAALFVGILFGIWSVSFGRRVTREAIERTPDGKTVSVPSMSSAEIAGRHYFGYVIGLAAGLAVSSAFDVR